MSQSNRYGLDFLRSEHILGDDDDDNDNIKANHDDEPNTRSSWIGVDTEALVAAVANKPDLEKQFDVMNFLKAHRSAGWMPPSVIYQRTGIDLEDDVRVAEMLQRNPKISVESVPDPENPSLYQKTYAYQAKYNHVRDGKTLLAQINRCKNGVPMKDLTDAYDGVETDLDALITAGDVIALLNTEDKDKILFPRGESFLVELDGIIALPEQKMRKKKPVFEPNYNGNKRSEENGGSSDKKDVTGQEKKPNGDHLSEEKKMKPISNVPVYYVDTDSDPRSQIRRGEAIQIGGTWFRVSSAVKEGPLKDQPARAQAPLSVVSLQDLSKRNEIDGYIRKFNDKTIPPDTALPPNAIQNLQKAKEARERLLKAAHGRIGGAASQLLGSNAHSSNPVSLAASFGSNAASSRRRPNKGGASAATHKEDSSQAKEAALDPYLSLYSHARRHGCTRDVREMYLKTRSKVPNNDLDLKAALIENKLLEPGEELRRARLQKRSNVDNDGKPKKRRYYVNKNQRMTNTHLEGTEIGAVLRRAADKQRQGEAVGDGGM
jgi:hypothetical protein